MQASYNLRQLIKIKQQKTYQHAINMEQNSLTRKTKATDKTGRFDNTYSAVIISSVSKAVQDFSFALPC